MLARSGLQAIRRAPTGARLRRASTFAVHATFHASSNALQRRLCTKNAFNRIWLYVGQQLSVSPQSRRTFLSASIPSILVPPLVFIGLLITLWTYKCVMMVLFQNKIIYMPYMPPFARSERADDYASHCKPVQWKEEHIRSLDGTRISLAVGKIPRTEEAGPLFSADAEKEVVICYFQGNGGSLPPRLPLLSSVLKSIHARTSGNDLPHSMALIALSYRGYWTSSGRASQSGIERDGQALLNHVKEATCARDKTVELILWGQSLGAGVASTAAATYASNSDGSKPRIIGMILETPFSSIKSMLIALYPQKWLPYRYLGPFLWSRWNSEAALTRIASVDRRPKILLLPATRDEVVPPEEANKLERLCRELGLDFRRQDIAAALHNEASTMRDGQSAIAKFIVEVMRSK